MNGHALRFLVCGLLLIALAGASVAVAKLVPVPVPPLKDMEPAVREQLTVALAELPMEEVDGPATERAEIFGETGRLLLAYDLVEAAEACFANARTLAPKDFRWAYLAGALYGNERRLPEAQEALHAALELAPDDLPSQLRLGEVYLAADDPQAAESVFQRALALDPESAAAHAGLGRAAAARDRPEAAVQHFERALALQDDATSLHYPLALALRELGRLDDARRYLALRGDGEVRFPDPLTRDLLSLTTGAGIHLLFGYRALQADKMDLAEKRFRQALEAHAESAEAHRALAAVLVGRGDLPAAVRHYSASLALEPDNPNLHYNLGTTLLETGETAQALRHFEAALRLAPDYDNARYNLAIALAQANRHAEAWPHFEILLQRPGRDHATRFYAAATLHPLGRSRQSLELLDGLVAEAPQRPRVRLLRSRVALDLGETATARRDLETLLASEATEGERRIALERLARLEAREGRLVEATQAFRRALELTPGDADLRFGLAMSLLLAERYSEAAQDLDLTDPDPRLRHLAARFRATCPEASLRSGEAALEAARAVFRQSPGLETAQTVAMALAELGRFTEAAEWQRRLLNQLHGGGTTPPPEVVERLAAYERGEAVRAPWLEGVDKSKG